MSANSNPTQAQRVLAYIEEHGSITQFEAFSELGIMRLASRISDLRRMGFPIISETEKVKNRFDETCHVKKYSLGESNGRI
jgi:hypothetical protein